MSVLNEEYYKTISKYREYSNEGLIMEALYIILTRLNPEEDSEHMALQYVLFVRALEQSNLTNNGVQPTEHGG